MSHSAWLLSLVLMAGVAVCGWAEEGNQNPGQKAQETKTWQGQLGRSSQAMASLMTHPENKEERPQTLLLFVKQGDVDTLKALNELLALKPLPYATVTGIMAPDGMIVQIVSLQKSEAPKKEGRKKK